MSRPDLLDRNLRRLLRRAYRPAAPTDAYRAELKSRVLRRFAEDGPERAAGPAAPIGPAGRPVSPVPRFAAPLLAAAALLLVAAALVLLVPSDSTSRTREALLARGETALRDAPVGGWWAADAPRTRLPPGGFLQVATPAAATHAGDLPGGGRLLAAASSEVELSAAADGTSRAWLTAGAAEVDAEGGETWTVRSSGGAVELDAAAARFLHVGPDTSRVEVRRGTATWRGPDAEPRVLRAVSTWRLREGAAPVRIDGDGATPGRPEKELVRAEDAPVPALPAAEGGEDDPAEAPDAAAAPRIAGTVRDDATDLPVPRFRVAAVAITLGGEPAYGRDPFVRSFADERGAFAFDGLPPGTFKLFVTADGYATWRSELVVLGTVDRRVEARLVRGAAVRGTVVDRESGRPVAGAFVFSQTDAPALLVPMDVAHLEGPLAAEGRTATTDAEGRFELRSLAPGDARLRASRSGSAPAWVDVPDLRAGESRGGVTLGLAAGGGVRGHVRGADGSPLGAVPIIAMPQDRYADEHGMPYGVGVTDGDGAYAIPDLPPGMFVLVLLSDLEPTDLDSVRTVQPARVRAGEWIEIDFGARRADGTRLTGRLTDAAGRVEPGLMLTLSRQESALVDQESWVTSTTDADGRFGFDHVRPGPHVLYLTDTSGGRVQEVGVVDVPAVPEHAVDLVLPGAEIGGRVVDDRTGAGLPFSLVLLVPDDGRRDDSIAAKVACDAAGAFRLRFVRPGPYRLRAIPAREELGTVDVALHLDVDGKEEVTLRAASGGALRVTVVDPSGAAVGDAAVRLFDETGRPFSTAWNPRTDAHGSRTLGQLPPGTWTVE
ncbi:MAG: carboxypeptidase regulatory-like domain-containing protein, partial [Planctomycetota bacterium JB042]